MENLYDDVKKSDKEAWIEKVTAELKGADFNEKLNSNVNGLIISPLYTNGDIPKYEHDPAADFLEDFDPEFVESAVSENGEAPTWNICEEVFMEADDDLNEIVMESLKRGSNYLRLTVSENGTWDHAVDHITKLKYPVNFSFNVYGDLSEDNIANLWRERIGFIGERDRLIQSLEFDPIGYWMQTGKIENESRSFSALADVFFRISGHLQDCKLLKIDLSVDSISNKDAVNQLADALAIISDYFDKLSHKNVPLEELIHLISFRFAVGSDYFIEIAKLRAFKVLWNNLLKAFIEDIEFIPSPFIHVVTNYNKFNTDDPYNNLLSATTQAMSGILGGCDSLTISGFEDSTDYLPGINKRSATNIQNILRYESHLDSFHQAANGSFYIESLTAQLAEKAWISFQEIESKGGFLELWQLDQN